MSKSRYDQRATENRKTILKQLIVDSFMSLIFLSLPVGLFIYTICSLLNFAIVFK